MSPITKLLLTFAMMTGAASAQQLTLGGLAKNPPKTFYASSGKVVGRSATDSQGTTTNYDARGKVISHESTSGNTATIYDASGRVVGRQQ